MEPKKTVLCFGDSNTWGYDPISAQRHPYDDRWTTVLQRELGPSFLVIPEGQNGRTTVWDDPIERDKNGAAYLPPCLESHKPVDLLIILLGTNDLKARFSVPAQDIARSVETLVHIARVSGSGPGDEAPGILVLIPPTVRKLTDFGEMFSGAVEKSREFSRVFAAMGEEIGVPVLDIGKTVRFSDADGIHFESDQLAPLGSLVAAEARRILS